MKSTFYERQQPTLAGQLLQHDDAQDATLYYGVGRLTDSPELIKHTPSHVLISAIHLETNGRHLMKP
jgi:hypothetical protein